MPTRTQQQQQWQQQQQQQPAVAGMNLDQLPESVKRNILGRVLPPTDRHDSPHTPAAVPPSTYTSMAQDIAGRAVLLPAMHAGAAIVDGVLSCSEVQATATAARAWLAQHGRRPGMGSNSSGGLWQDASYRGDITCWATGAELQAAGQALPAACLKMLAGLRLQLAAQGYDVGGRISCQLACYPGKGARYVRHTDMSASAPDRSVTALLYLNPDWDTQMDGGQLALYNAAHGQHSPQEPHDSSSPTPQGTCSSHVPPAAGSSGDSDTGAGAGYLAGEPALLVSPMGGRLLVFDSTLPHEVLPAHNTRLSITAWFYKQPAAAQRRPTTSCFTTEQMNTLKFQIVLFKRLRKKEQVTADEVASIRPPPLPAASQQHSAAAVLPPAAAVAADQAAVPDAAGVAAATAQQAAGAARGPAPSAGSLPRIFVSVAAFRDADCQWTLRDLFVKAAHPGRVFVGVVWQIDSEADAGFVRMAGGTRTAGFLPQVREVRCHYGTATGPCAARSMAQQLWQGEEYVLQIDAHMRFVQDWDALCIAELQAAQQAAGHQSVVLSTYPLGFDGEGAAAAVPDAAAATLLCAKEFDEAGLLRIKSRCLVQRPAHPLPSHFWAAGFSFAPSSWLLGVPYCPHLPHLFFGEEQYMLLRMWTRGWDVYAPTQPLAFHKWERSARAHSYQACVEIDPLVRAASQARVLDLVQSAGDASSSVEADVGTTWHRAQPATAQDWAVGGVWGLGTARSLKLYEQQAGVCFGSRSIDVRPLPDGVVFAE